MFPKLIKKMDEKKRVYGVSFLKKELTLTLDVEKCQACGICVEACPKEALEIVPKSKKAKNDVKAFIPDIESPDKCSYCGVCQIMCPFEAISLNDTGKTLKNEDIEIVKKKAMPEINAEMVESTKLKRKIKSYFEGTITLKDNSDWSGYKICADVCPTDALTFDDKTNTIKLDQTKCIFCGSCRTVAPNKEMINITRSAIKISGSYDAILWDPLWDRLTKFGKKQNLEK